MNEQQRSISQRRDTKDGVAKATFKETTNTSEFRTTRDGFAHTRSRTADALQPLIDGVKNLEQRVDCFVASAEKRIAVAAEKRRVDRAAEADRQLRARLNGIEKRIYSATEYQASEAFKRRLDIIFGRASKND